MSVAVEEERVVDGSTCQEERGEMLRWPERVDGGDLDTDVLEDVDRKLA